MTLLCMQVGDAVVAGKAPPKVTVYTIRSSLVVPRTCTSCHKVSATNTAGEGEGGRGAPCRILNRANTLYTNQFIPTQ